MNKYIIDDGRRDRQIDIDVHIDWYIYICTDKKRYTQWGESPSFQFRTQIYILIIHIYFYNLL